MDLSYRLRNGQHSRSYIFYPGPYLLAAVRGGFESQKIMFTDRYQIENTSGLDFLNSHGELLDEMNQASVKIQRLTLEKLASKWWRKRSLYTTRQEYHIRYIL
jgi:hypothetical protein